MDRFAEKKHFVAEHSRAFFQTNQVLKVDSGRTSLCSVIPGESQSVDVLAGDHGAVWGLWIP